MKNYLVVLIILMPLLSYSQKQGKSRIDSCLDELRSDRFRKKGDSARVRLLCSISHQFSTMNPDSGIKYGLEALKIAEKMKWKRGMAAAYNPLCSSSGSKSDFTNAITYGQKALALNRELDLKLDMAANLGNLGNCYIAISENARALECFFETLKISEENNDEQSMALSLSSIGSLYSEIKNYEKSLVYLSKSLTIFRKLNDSLNIATDLSNIGAAYLGLKKPAQALSYELEALKILEKQDNQFAIMIIASTAGDAYLMQKKYTEALHIKFRALALNRKMGSKEYLGGTLCSIGEVYYRIAADTGRKNIQDSLIPAGQQAILDLSIEYLEQGIRESENGYNIRSLMGMQNVLADAYEMKGDLAAALRHYKASSSLKDSIFSHDNKLRIAALETKRETQLKEKQIEINRLLAKEKRNEQTIFIVGIALLSIVAIIVIKSYNAQSKVNKANVALLLQKDILMKEIHHRVKNNLQVISTLLDLQMNSISDEHARDAMTESATRVKSISLIHQQLYQNENLNTIKFATFTKDLLNQITTVFKKSGLQISLKSEFPETEIDIDTAVPLGLILNELMTNSYKHAFNSVPYGVIEVSMQKIGGRFRLTYKDSGPGLPENMDVNTLNSLGMKLIGRLCKQIGGKLSYIKAENTFAIAFNDAATRKLVD